MTRTNSARTQPTIGIVSLGCPKALVDSERILTKLRADGYALTSDYDEADAVIVNTCGFLDSSKAESLDAIGEAIQENGRVIVTGCLGKEADSIRSRYPNVLAVTGPQQYETVVNAVHDAVPPQPDPFLDLVPPEGIRLTPRHFAYLKISEGCNHKCSFCVIPQMRGKLVSRPASHVMHEAERLVRAGVQELLVISQDTSAYGIDIRHQSSRWHDEDIPARLVDLARALGQLGVWVRLHYVYPYRHVDNLIPLMADGLILPYLDIPFQHASPSVLRAMRRPAHQEKTLERIAAWRAICPDLAIRSTFIVGFPGETDEDFEYLLQWLGEARLDRVGCFRYDDVDGASANHLKGHVPEPVKEERWNRFMEIQQAISHEKLKRRIGQTLDVLIDEVHEDGAIGRSYADAPEIDGSVHLPDLTEVSPGDIVTCTIADSDDYDLIAGPPPAD